MFIIYEQIQNCTQAIKYTQNTLKNLTIKIWSDGLSPVKSISRFVPQDRYNDTSVYKQLEHRG